MAACLVEVDICRSANRAEDRRSIANDITPAMFSSRARIQYRTVDFPVFHLLCSWSIGDGMHQIWRYSAVELANAIARRELSSREVIGAHLSRIDDVNPKLNAVVEVLRESALVAADVADRAVASGAPLGALHGVPLTIKCNVDVEGSPSTWGARALAHAVASKDAPVVERVRMAGAIPIARTNSPDLGLRMHTDSSLYGLTRNPWNFDRTTSGSSGGEAAALAAGMSPLGIGSDLGGSLRNPANACGVASIKPTTGRIPYACQAPFDTRSIASQWMLVVGPMARRVADLRLGLNAMMGAHPRDPQAFNVPFDGPRQPVVRVAVMPTPPGGGCAPSVIQAVERAAAALSDAGYDVQHISPPSVEEAISLWGSLIAVDVGSAWPALAPLMEGAGKQFVEQFLADHPQVEFANDFVRLIVARDRLARAWSLFMADYPLILSPAWTDLPFTNGYDVSSVDATRHTLEMIRPVLPANLLGLPCACVPAAQDVETGLPIGVLLTGRGFREDQCLAAAEVIERLGAVTTPIDPVW